MIEYNFWLEITSRQIELERTYNDVEVAVDNEPYPGQCEEHKDPNGNTVRIYFGSPKETGKRVFVDAKIVGIHDPSLKRRAFVGYYSPESNEHNVREEKADETDEAEIQAVLFAIEELASPTNPITIVCDHESVVSEATKQTPRRPSRPIQNLRKVLEEKKSYVKLEALLTNPAHKTLTEYVNKESRGDKNSC